MFPALSLILVVSLIPVVNRLAVMLAQSLNADWRATALEWARESDAPSDVLHAIEDSPAMPTPEPRAAEIWTLGSIVAVLTALWIWQSSADLVSAGCAAALGLGLLIAMFVDIRIQLLPDVVFWPLAALGAVVSISGIGIDPRTALLGAVAGGGSLWLVAMVFRVVRGQEGLGMGDVKLVALAGLWLGWMPLPWLVLIASCVAIILFLGLYRISPERRVPFGPALACAFLLTRVAAPLIFAV